MKAILLIWIGVGSYAQLALEKFDSVEECRAAQEALADRDLRLRGECIAYAYDSNAKSPPHP